jgi:hypothetical protein
MNQSSSPVNAVRKRLEGAVNQSVVARHVGRGQNVTTGHEVTCLPSKSTIVALSVPFLSTLLLITDASGSGLNACSVV